MEPKYNHPDLSKLSAYFLPSQIEWRPIATNEAKDKALVIAYIDARAIMDRLDEVVGPENWKQEFSNAPGQESGVLCRLSIRINGEWIGKTDGAGQSEVEPVKGGLSNAFRRAAVSWGIGRYLYSLPQQWVPCRQVGKSIVLTHAPRIPDEFLPGAAKRHEYQQYQQAEPPRQHADRLRSFTPPAPARATPGTPHAG